MTTFDIVLAILMVGPLGGLAIVITGYGSQPEGNGP